MHKVEAAATCGATKEALWEAALFGLVCIVPLHLILSHDRTAILVNLQSVVVSFLQQPHMLTLTAGVLYVQRDGKLNQCSTFLNLPIGSLLSQAYFINHASRLATAFLVIQLMPIKGSQDQEFEQSYCCAKFSQPVSCSQVIADLLPARDGGKEPAFDVWAFERARFVEPSNAQTASIFSPQRSAPSVLSQLLHIISRVSCLSLSALL